MDDFNGKVGKRVDEEDAVEEFGSGEQNERAAGSWKMLGNDGLSAESIRYAGVKINIILRYSYCPPY